MTRKRAARGPVLPSVVMVLLATVATGLLVVIGFQAVGENVVATTFHRTDRESRNVDVSNSPSSPPRATPKPGIPSATGSPQATAEEIRSGSGRGHTGHPAGNGSTITAAPKPTGGTTTAPKTAPKPSPSGTTKPAPKPSPSPSPTHSPSPSPSPTPTCKGRGPKCPRISAPAVNTYSFTGYTQTSSGSTTATKPGKVKATKGTKATKAHGRARRAHLAR